MLTVMYFCFKNIYMMEQVVKNAENFVWDFKKLIGTNSAVKDVNEEIESGLLKSNVVLDENMATYKVMFNNEEVKFSTEYILSILLKYCYYFCSKTESDGYDDMEEVSMKTNNESKVVMTVCYL